MKVNIKNFEENSEGLFDLSIVQGEVGGGVTSKAQIDGIQDHPNAKSLMISGLEQDTFEYFIKRFGNQFEAISFWKNKLIRDLSPLGNLKGLQYIHFFFNQKVTDLWDMKDNGSLRGLAIYDLLRLHSIDKITTAHHLAYFSLGNKVWSKMEIDSLKPLMHSSVSHFGWWGNRVLDNDYMCLAQSKIKELDMSIGKFKVEELAKLVASIPELKGMAVKPYVESSIIHNDVKTTYYFLCKGKKKLVQGQDDDKLKKYLEEFQSLVEGYRVK